MKIKDFENEETAVMMLPGDEDEINTEEEDDLREIRTSDDIGEPDPEDYDPGDLDFVEEQEETEKEEG